MRNGLLILCLAAFSCPIIRVNCQESVESGWENVLETLLSDEDLSADAIEELSILYESLHAMPLNINTATREELLQLPFLTELQIEDIHAYIYMHGPMLTLGELQLTGSLDYRTRSLLREFVYAGQAPLKRKKMSIADILLDGKNEVITRADIPLYMRDGFRYHSPDELQRYPNRAYMGRRLSHSVRYSFNWHNRVRFGFTADHDAGEPFAGLNRTGYDFWSPYLYIKDAGVLKEAVLGKFKAKTGLGLLLGGGFSVGKDMAVSSIERTVQGLKPHSSTQEYDYLQGIGLAVGTDHTTFTVLGAYTPVDATVKGDSVIGSFKQDGYHRTALEWSKKYDISLSSVAANVRYSYRGFGLGTTMLMEKLSLPYKGNDRFIGISADFSLHRSRYALTSELSVLNSKPAVLAWLLVRPGGGWNISSVLRYYSPDYMSLHANALADAGVTNEAGVMTGVSYGSRRLKTSGYVDLFMHPQPRYGASAKSYGMDVRIEADWRMGPRDEIFSTARFKAKQKDCNYTGRLEYCLTSRYKVRWTHTCGFGAQLKTQLLYSRYDFIAEPISNGWAFSQTYSQSLFDDCLDVSVTASAFHTDSYDSRVSVYENGLRYSYNFISLYGKGARLSATIRYKLSDAVQVRLKFAGTRYLDRDEISSAQQRIAANHKEDISIQLQAKF